MRLALAAGALALVASLAVDAIGLGGGPGFGTKQRIAAGVGLALLGGAWLVSAALRARVFAAAGRLPPVSGAQCVLLGCGVGVLLGWIEWAHLRGVKVGLQGVILRQPEHLVWMAPLNHGAVFAALGGVLGIGARCAPGLVRLPVVVFVLIGIAAYSQCLLHPVLAGVAVVALSAGVGLLAARSAARAPRRAVRWAGRTAAVAAAVAAATGVGIAGYQRWSQHRAVATLPAPPADAANVLLIVLDTVRADHLSLAGYHRETSPSIDALGRDGVTLTRALTTAPWTLPSHATLFTGRYPHEMSADWLTPLDDAHPTLAEVLRDRGYVTGGFVGNLLYCLANNGLGRGFARYDDLLVTPATIAASTALARSLLSEPYLKVDAGSNRADTVTDRLLDWIDQRGERPFFAFANYIDAHAYCVSPEGFTGHFGEAHPDIFDWYDFAPGQWNDEKWNRFRDAYDDCIRFIDFQVSRIVDHLRAQGVLEHTLIVVTSDHGELFGEHGLADHGNSLYRPLVQAPLVWHYPAGLAPRPATDTMVSQRDVPATLLDLIGVTGHPLPGNSLAPMLRGAPPGEVPRSPLLCSVTGSIRRPAWEPASRGDMHSLFDGDRQLIIGGDGAAELFDLGVAADAETDLSAQEPGVVDRLRSALRALVPE